MKTPPTIALIAFNILLTLILTGCGAAPGAPAEPTPGAPQTGSMQAQCNAGDMEACITLKRIYSNDKNAPNQIRSAQIQDSPCDPNDPSQKCQSTADLQQACKNDVPNACLQLGIAYAQGKDVPQDLQRATQLFQAECYAGNPKACQYAQNPQHPDLTP